MTSEASERNAMLTMALVIANAQRLLDDARLLCEHGRFPTALSIAVLSMEESGKALLMCRSTKQKDLRHHVTKQTDAALQLVQNDLISAMKEVGWWEDGASSEPTNDAGSSSYPSEERVDALIAALDEVRKSDVVRRYLAMQAGVGDRAKMLGLYVDVDSRHQTTSAPFGVDITSAREYIDLAEASLKAVYDVTSAQLVNHGFAIPLRLVRGQEQAIRFVAATDVPSDDST